MPSLSYNWYLNRREMKVYKTFLFPFVIRRGWQRSSISKTEDQHKLFVDNNKELQRATLGGITLLGPILGKVFQKLFVQCKISKYNFKVKYFNPLSFNSFYHFITDKILLFFFVKIKYYIYVMNIFLWKRQYFKMVKNP